MLFEITPFSLLDYPKEMACIAWIAGCNMRCAYCHNPAIVLGKGTKPDDELIAFLEKRIGKLTAVVFSGGEATLYAGLPDLMRRVRAMGFKIKLDTNGSRPDVLRGLLDEKLLDYVALDYKCPLEKTKALIGTAKLWKPFRESLELLITAAGGDSAFTKTPSQKNSVIPAKAGIQSHKKPTGSPSPLDPRLRGDDKIGECAQEDEKKSIALEVRTTFHPDLMDEADLAWIIRDLESLNYKGTYYIQNIASTGEKTIGNIPAPSRTLDLSLLPKAQGFEVKVRN